MTAENAAQLPRYRCHKEVWALKIESVEVPALTNSEEHGSRILHFENKTFSPMTVDRDYVSKHKPEAGGYYIQYKDGYKSFSPAEAFEEGYTLIK